MPLAGATRTAAQLGWQCGWTTVARLRTSSGTLSNMLTKSSCESRLLGERCRCVSPTVVGRRLGLLVSSEAVRGSKCTKPRCIDGRGCAGGGWFRIGGMKSEGIN
jgi:hypothetical protein